MKFGPTIRKKTCALATSVVLALAQGGCTTLVEPTPEVIPLDKAVFRGCDVGSAGVILHAADGKRSRRRPFWGFGRMAADWIEFVPSATKSVDLNVIGVGRVESILEGVEVRLKGGHSYLIRGEWGPGYPGAPKGTFFVWIEDEKTGELASERIALWEVSEQRNGP